MNSKQFVAKLAQDNEALFKASELNVEAYFASNPSQEQLVEHFTGRMVNERMNMVEIAGKVASAPADTSVEELSLLSKQALDEANHFRMVKEVIEHITGEKVDVEAAIAAEAAKPTAKGAALLAKYEAQNDPLALAAYQFIAEGRAERVWNKMAECIQDEYISTTYAKIARDEGFHSNIGRRSLELLATDEATQARIEAIARTMRMDLFAVSCMNTTATPEAIKLMDAAY
jgi:1,2-phenylacetyl-CoA epoxidase catalytic subunit